VIAKVEAHEHKRLIIAYKYEGETEFRYVIAINMSWMPLHVIETYSLRWLIEVFTPAQIKVIFEELGVPEG
jgi:hypothetical protein